MSKNRKNATKSAHAVPHTDLHAPPAPAPHSNNGHVVYPELIKQQSRLESLSRTFRNLVPSFTPSSFSNQSSPTPASTRNTYGSYASTPTSEQVPEESKLDNTVTWSNWITFDHRTLLLVGYRLSGFHIWDVTSLDSVKEKLYLPSIGPVIAACILPDIDAPLTELLLLVGSGNDTTLSIYSLQSHTVTTRISTPHARTLEANSRFICIGVSSSSDSESTSAIHVLSTKPDHTLLYTVPSSVLSPNSPSPVFALSNSRLLAYSSVPPPTHRQQSPPTSSYPPSNPFATSPIPPSSSPITSGLASGMVVVGSGMLTGAKFLGSGMIEGVKLGMNAAGYRTATAGGGTGEGAIPEGGVFSRSAPTGNASPLSSRGHSRRASGNINVRSAVSGPGSNTGGGPIDGSWVTIVDLQPLLPVASAGDGRDVEEAGDFLQPIRSSSFHANFPPLRTLTTASSTTSPTVLAEFQYSAPSSSSSLRPIGRYSPGPGTPTMTPLAKHTSEAITTLKWNRDGAMLAIGGNEGGSVKVYKIARVPKSRRAEVQRSKGDGSKEVEGLAKVVPAFDMMRGVTPASIVGIEWSSSGLWSGFVSGNGTLHMFAVSPEGGIIDEASHLTGKTRNVAPRRQAESSVRLSAIARLRKPLLPMTDEPAATSRPTSASKRASDSNLPSLDELSATPTLAPPAPTPSFTFVSNAHSLSSKRVPIPRDSSSRPITPSDPAPSGDGHSNNQSGFQDLLIFDPEEAVLVLWRCTLHSSSSNAPAASSSERPSMERTTSIVGEAAVEPGVDVSAKGGGVGSIPIGGVLSGVAKMTGLSRVADTGIRQALGGGGMSGEGALVASWDLKRAENWVEVKDSFAVEQGTRPLDNTKTPHLSHAELTTFPPRSLYLKRPIYLSRQFNFSALTTDYHALLRRLDFDPPTVPIVVRKDTVVVRSGEDLHGHDTGTSLPSDFDSQGDFLGANAGPLDLTDSPLLGGHLGLVADHPPFSSSLASTSATSFSSPSRGPRRTIRHSFDDSISSAIGSNLQLDNAYSPSGSSSDIASPGHVIPMLPNGRPGSVGSGVGIAGGLDAVMRGTTRVGKEVWGGLTNARSPRLVPTKRTSATGDLLKFDEADEMFMVDDIDITGDGSGAGVMKKEASEATINPITWSVESGSIYPRMTDSGMTIGPSSNKAGATNEDGTWVAQQDVYNQAVEEDTRYDDVTGILDEEREERKRMQAKMGGVAEGTKASEGMKKGGKKSGARRKKKGVS